MGSAGEAWIAAVTATAEAIVTVGRRDDLPADAANRAAVAAVAGDDLDLVGLAIRGPRNGVDRVTKGCPLHG